MPKTPPLNAIKSFESSARHLNFRLAADELNVTQGAVAQQVRGLEELLGIKLFNRLPRGLSLTEEGRNYFNPISQAIHLISEATEILQPSTKIINISVTPSFASKWLVPRLQNFTELHPDIDVRISASENLANFQNDKIDLAVRLSKPPFPAHMKSRFLYPTKITAVCSPFHFSVDRQLTDPEDILNHTLIHDGHGQWPLYFEKLGIKVDLNMVRVMKFNQTSLAIDAAIAGQGIALASTPLIEDDLKSGRLICPFDLSLETDRGFYILAPKTTSEPELIEKFSAWLVGQSQKTT